MVLTFYSVLLLAGGQDIWAQKLGLSLSTVLWTFRVLVFVLPLLTGAFTYKLCRDLVRAEEIEGAEKEEEIRHPEDDDGDLPPPPPPPTRRSRRPSGRQAPLVLARGGQGWIVDRLRGRRQVRR